MRTWRYLFRWPWVAFVAAIFVVLLVSQVFYFTDQLDLSSVERHQRELLAAHYQNSAGSNNSDGVQLPMVYYQKETPLIWIGGVPRSGTTLMRAMLDAHPEVRCGEETRVIPRILGIHHAMAKTEVEMKRLEEAHITEKVLNDALAAYLLSIISQHGEPAPRLCNKDPFALKSMRRIYQMFPKSKFILMLRDGRAVVHSIISRKVSIKGFDYTSYRGALVDWNRAISTMYSECLSIGASVCLPVHYEQLVLHPQVQMKKILSFLDLSWSDLVLQHEKMIGQDGGVSLSKRELSTDQVDKPVNMGALTKWVGHIPTDVREEMRKIAPMLANLGYDPDAYPPNYGTPDRTVVDNSLKVGIPLNESVGIVNQVS